MKQGLFFKKEYEKNYFILKDFAEEEVIAFRELFYTSLPRFGPDEIELRMKIRRFFPEAIVSRFANVTLYVKDLYTKKGLLKEELSKKKEERKKILFGVSFQDLPDKQLLLSGDLEFKSSEFKEFTPEDISFNYSKIPLVDIRPKEKLDVTITYLLDTAHSHSRFQGTYGVGFYKLKEEVSLEDLKKEDLFLCDKKKFFETGETLQKGTFLFFFETDPKEKGEDIFFYLLSLYLD